MKKVLSILLVLVLVAALAACGNGAQDTPAPVDDPTPTPDVAPPVDEDPPADDTPANDGTLRIGFSQIGSESDWRVGNTESVRQAVADAGWELIFNDANQQQHNQIQAIQDFITQGVDYIVLAPIVETGWDSIMMDVAEAGIPLILMDRSIDMPNQEDYFVSWVTNNFEDEGRRAGEWLLDFLEEEGRLGDDINIVELQGTVGSGPAIDRAAGFREIIGGHANLEITQSQTGDFTTELGMQVMESFLGRASAEGRPIDVLYAHNDGMALGAIQAIRDAGLVPGEDIIIIGVDAVLLAFEAIVAGDMNVTVECSPLLGPTVVQVIRDIEAGITPEQIIFSDVRVFDETLSLIFPDRYLSAADDLPNRVY
ncbi:MAG: ABC transporter substrate-binding protein [Oscillospiraceae bacterium]|nr:ABC transporter substrate-binding protein [Oscillospiraceae bacterium]